MKVAMLGMGRLGCPVSCAMVMKGHEVNGYDIVLELREELKKGKSNLYEPDIEERLQWSLQNGLTICDAVYDAVKDAEIIFIAVPTPSNPDGSFDTGYVKAALKKIVEALMKSTPIDYHVISIISTVLPGTVRNEFLPILEFSGLGNWEWGLCYNAQFIAMGTTIEDMLNPEFVLIGEYDKRSGDVLGSFYSQLVDAPLLRMSIESAEVVKMSYNTMIGFKIVYGNTLMELCDKVTNADVDDVYGAISKATTRLLSPRYLKGGLGDGGGCFPPGEIVITEKGVVPIESISPGDRVLTIDGSLQEVFGKWERLYDDDLIEMKVRGLPPVRLTTNHRMIVAEDGRYKYENGKRDTRTSITDNLGEQREILAGELTTNHLIPFPIPSYEIGLKDIEKWEHVSFSYIELAGWYLSEGWAELDNRHGRVGFALHKRELDSAKRIGELCLELDPPSGRRSSAKVSIKESSENGIELRYGSKRLAKKLSEDFGRGAANKRIPEWIVYGDIEWAKLLMKGLWKGDGHTNKNRVFLTTISRQLAWDTHLILLRLGIPSTIRDIPERTGSDGQHHRRAYEVRVANKKYRAAMENITSLKDKSKPQDKLYDVYGFRDNSIWRHVYSLNREKYHGKVYNLWVDGNNTYVVGCGAVHNCHPRDNRALSFLARQLQMSADPFAFVMDAREKQSRELARVIKEYCDIFHLPLAIMGLTFKPETNLTVDSPSLLLIEHLLDLYLQPAYTHDPIINDVEIPKCPKIYVLATCHEQYKDYLFEEGSVIIDPWRMLSSNPPPNCIYRPIGK